MELTRTRTNSQTENPLTVEIFLSKHNDCKPTEWPKRYISELLEYIQLEYLIPSLSSFLFIFII